MVERWHRSFSDGDFSSHEIHWRRHRRESWNIPFLRWSSSPDWWSHRPNVYSRIHRLDLSRVWVITLMHWSFLRVDSPFECILRRRWYYPDQERIESNWNTCSNHPNVSFEHNPWRCLVRIQRSIVSIDQCRLTDLSDQLSKLIEIRFVRVRCHTQFANADVEFLRSFKWILKARIQDWLKSRILLVDSVDLCSLWNIWYLSSDDFWCVHRTETERTCRTFVEGIDKWSSPRDSNSLTSNNQKRERERGILPLCSWCRYRAYEWN